MDASTPRADELNDLASRLAAWKPSTTGLDRDRMLFDAGRQSAQPGRGRVAWPVISGCLAILAATLGVELVRDRSARMAISGGLRQIGLAVHENHQRPPVQPPIAEPPAPDSYLAASRLMTDDLEKWPILAKTDSPITAAQSRPVLKANSTAEALER